jgi:hypothetical protein
MSQWLRFLPATALVGTCVFNDMRGTDRFIYVFLGGTPATLWRYDRWTDSYQGIFNIIGGTDRALTYAFDPSRNGF